MNKSDLIEDRSWPLPRVSEDEIWMAAGKGEGIAELIMMITGKLYADSEVLDIMLPFDKGSVASMLHQKADVIREEYTASGIRMKVECPKEIAGDLKRYAV